MEKEEIKFYKDLVKDHRGTSMQIGCSQSGQTKRFEALAGVIESMLGGRLVKDLRVLDFGCGKGDFIKYIHCGKYIGVDAIEENIEDAKRNFPGGDFRLLNWSGAGSICPEGVDLIIFSGPFATTEHKKKLVMFQRLLKMANYGVIGNFLTENKLISDYKGCVLTKPSDIMELIDTSVYGVELKMDYLPHDFTIGAIKWEKLS